MDSVRFYRFHGNISKSPYLKKINWRIIVLQCCIGFCCIITWISHKYVFVYTVYTFASLLVSSLPFDPSPLGHYTVLKFLTVPFYKEKQKQKHIN